MTGIGGRVATGDVYRAVERHSKARANRHWKAKVGQVLQGPAFQRVGRGVYRLSVAA